MAPVALFLLHAAVVIGLPYILWSIGGRRWMPLVVVQILVGLLLGPTVLGTLAPEFWSVLFPARVLDSWNGLVWLGVTYFAFATGLHFDVTEFQGRGRAFAITSTATFAVPTVAGCVAGILLLWLVPGVAGEGTSPWAFGLGVGIAVGVTALPVLAAILREMNLQTPWLGNEALGCAAVNDAALWIAIAILLAISAGEHWWQAGLVLCGSIAYGAALWFVVRPMLAAYLVRSGSPVEITERHVVFLSVGVLLSALITENLGLHALVGGFAFGSIIPKAVARQVLDRVEAFLMAVLLPFFFMSTGLKTNFVWASGAGLVFALTTIASLSSKMLAAALPARLQGQSWNRALALGALVSCKGLMELVVLTMLLERGILSPSAFSGMVLMALVTTALARPLAGFFLGRDARESPHR